MRLFLSIQVCLTFFLSDPSLANAVEGKLLLSAVDATTHKPVACRLHLTGPGKRPKKIEGFPFWSDHVVFPGKILLNLPIGYYTFELERGPEYYNVMGNFTIERFADDSKEVELRRAVNMSEEGWWSGDLHLRRNVRDLPMIVSADDLHVAEATTWWNDKLDIVAKSLNPPKNRLVTFDNDRVYELGCGGFTRGGTELLCFHLPAPIPIAAQNEEYPSLSAHLQQARQRENSELWIDAATSYGWDLPMLVANGLIDSIEVANGHFGRAAMQADGKPGKARDLDHYAGPFGYARWSQDVYFKFVDCGLRIPPTAGSGSGVSPNPAGYNRVYVHLDGSFDYQHWWTNLKAGQVVVTNGPLLRPRVENELPGHTFQGEPGRELTLQIGLTLTTREPISYLEIVQDGQVRNSIRFDDYVKTGRLPPLHFKQSGWFLLRAVAEISDTYRFAMTAPYYVEFDNKPRISKKSAQFFLDWVYERARQVKIDDPAKRREVMSYHLKARDYWQHLVETANAE
jgi:hypothetical protein